MTEVRPVAPTGEDVIRLALPDVGSLTAGGRADVVVVDDGLSVQRVLRGGVWL